MKKIITQNLGYRLIALLLAILLFAYVKTDHLTSTRVSGSDGHSNEAALMSTKTKTVSMPVDLDVNTSKYVVSGYKENVKVTLSGTSAMITTLTNTRNFKVYLDLESYTSGVHTVKYKVSGLGKDIKYTINPETARITIAKREIKNFEVHYRYDENMIKSGYTVGSVKSSMTNVQATGSEADIARITQVVADVNIPSNSTKDISAHPVLQAIDGDGNVVNVVLTPQTVNVTIPIHKKAKAKKAESSSTEKESNASADTETSSSVASSVNSAISSSDSNNKTSNN